MARKSPQKTPTTPAFSLISNEKLQQMYLAMLKCRILDSYFRRPSKSSFLKGREAALVASTIDLRSEDAIIDSSGGVVTSFLKGLPLSSFIAGANGSQGKLPAVKRKPSYSEVIECAIVTGIASAYLSSNPESIAVAFLSYSPAVSDAARGALLFSITGKLPVIYVYTGKEALKSETLSSLDLPVIRVDGSDVVAVYRVMHECAVRARRGTGPSVIACDFPANGARRNPIDNMQNYLAAKGLFHKDLNRSDLCGFEKKIKQAFKAKDAVSPSRAGNIFFV